MTSTAPKSQKVTVSLPASLLQFVDDYQAAQRLSRSEVVQQALAQLRDAELARAYSEAAAETQTDPLFDADPSDGLTPSTEESW